MSARAMIGAAVATVFVGAGIATSYFQGPSIRVLDEKVLREYTGAYQWEAPGAKPGFADQGQTPSADAFVYLQLWSEFGANQLVAFDESGELRALYSTDPDRFFAGPGAGVSSSIESRVEFQRHGTGAVTSLTWQREGAPLRTARRVAIEKQEDVRFSNGEIQLAGTLIRPASGAKHPAIILVHFSGPANRESVLPFARFLIRHGIAILGYDKRGVGGSTGDWNNASFEDLAGDVVAAFEYLKTRSDIDSTQVGLLGVSQAGWIMPIAAVRAKDLAFLISISGAGVPAAETGIDHARNEMTAGGMPAAAVEQIISVMTLQYEFARTGRGWDEYLAMRSKIAARMGAPPDNFPGTPDHPYWQFIRRLVIYDPGPTLRQLQTPTLALFGELDNNILAVKNAAAWRAALEAGGHRDCTLRILPNANHYQLEAKLGTNAENVSRRRFVPAYAATIRDWLATRLRGVGMAR